MAGPASRPPAHNFKDLAGIRFGRLLALSPVRRPGRRLAWQCRCDCGRHAVCAALNLMQGITASCGCLHRELMTTHGRARTAEYKVWRGIINRCFLPSHPSHHLYRDRGMAEEWRRDFMVFFAHVGPRPSPAHQIERFDNERGYFPGNVGWALPAEQSSNTRRNVWWEHDGKRMTPTQWARHLGVPHGRLMGRRRMGWPVERILARG
jgi:hypothetical protein